MGWGVHLPRGFHCFRNTTCAESESSDPSHFRTTLPSNSKCRSESIHGDMTKEVNDFHLGKQPRDVDDQSFEVNLIEGQTSEYEEELEYESDLNLIWSQMTSILTR